MQKHRVTQLGGAHALAYGLQICALACAALWLSACDGTIVPDQELRADNTSADLVSCVGGSSGSGSTGGTGGISGAGGSYAGTGGSSSSGGTGGSSSSGGGAVITSGWTTFTPTSGARTIYVSNSGNDSWPGTSAQPKATIQAGYNALRDGQADWLLLERGSRWNLNNFMFTKSGPVADNAGWMRLGAYGDESRPRPRIDSGSGSAIVFTPGYRGSRPIAHFAMTDIHVVAQGRLNARTTSAEATGINLIAIEYQGSAQPFQKLLFENVKIEGYSMGFVTGRDVYDLKLRRCIFTEIFLAGGAGVNSSALLSTANTLLLEDNVFYRVQYTDMPGVGAISYFSHSAYIGAEARNVTSRGNIIIKATEGFMQRAGGSFERNVSLFNDAAASIGMAWGVTPTPGGVVANINDNLFLNANGSVTIGNTNSGSVRNNLLLRGPERGTNFGVALQGLVQNNMGVHNVRFDNNRIAGDISYGGAASTDTRSFSGLTFVGNTSNLGASTTSFSSFMSSSGMNGDVDAYGRELIARDRSNFSSRHRAETLINHYRRPYGIATLQ